MVKLTAMSETPEGLQRQNLREQVDSLLPSWQSWYPSLFDAAQDLGLIRARVCDPSTLMLSTRHAAVQSEAVQAFKAQWSVEDDPEMPEQEHTLMLRRIQNAARALKRPQPQSGQRPPLKKWRNR